MTPEGKIPFGNFVGGNKYEGYAITLKANGTFEQESAGNDWWFIARGKWTTSTDTIKLIADKIYSVNAKKKKTTVTDSDYKKFNSLNELIIIDQDTLVQLCKYLQSPTKQIENLVRQKK